MSVKQIRKTERGQPLNKKEIIALARYLGLVISPSKLFFIILNGIVSIFFILLSLGVFTHGNKNAWWLLLVIADFLFVQVIMARIPYKKRIQEYLEAVDRYYESRLSDYDGFQMTITSNIPSMNSYIQKSAVIFITDGYNYLIFEDFLEATDFPLNKSFRTKQNKNPILKVLDAEAINKKSISFKLADIVFYRLNVDKRQKNIVEEEYEFDLYTKVISPGNHKTFVEIELKDRSIFRVGISAYEFLKKAAPLKEAYFE